MYKLLVRGQGVWVKHIQMEGVSGSEACISLQVVQAFKILTSDKQVKAILVNIFGEETAP